jgi:hypothetical protein
MSAVINISPAWLKLIVSAGIGIGGNREKLKQGSYNSNTSDH